MNQELINKVKKACLDAGKAIMTIYETADFGVEMKANNSPLTLADKAGHDAIVDILQTTDYPVLSEEGRDIPYEVRKSWQRFWMVDPLDGTKEFIKRNGEFTVNIALIEDGKAIFGAVYVPVTDELYIGGNGIPAYMLKDGIETALKQNSVESRSELLKQSGLKVVASRSHLNDDTEAFVNSLESPTLVSMGSSLKFLALASERADVYPRFAPTMEWDTAAAHAVISSLNYRVTVKDSSEELHYNKENLLNPFFICY